MFLLPILLVAFAIASLVVGAATRSTAWLLLAAATSGIAVVLLWLRIRRERQDTFVTEPPAPSVPEWDRPRRAGELPEELEPGGGPELAIVDYEQLVTAEILPSLETLSVEELRRVIDRERGGLGRVVVLDRAKALIDLTEGSSLEANVDVRASLAPSMVELGEPTDAPLEIAQAAVSEPLAPDSKTRPKRSPAARSGSRSRTKAPEVRPPKAKAKERKNPDLSL